jgi:flagellar biosynthesis/type III secretory pathway protein FliH
VEIIRAERVFLDDPSLRNIPGREGIKMPAASNPQADGNAGMVIVQKPVFTEEFVFSGSNEPLEISLDNLEKESLPLEEAQREVQQAYERGFEDGRELTRSTLSLEIEKQQHWVRNFDSIFQELRVNFSKEIDVLADSVISLSVMIAGRILEHEVRSNPDTVIEQTRRALKALDDDTVFRIHLHPNSIDILEKVKSSLCADPSKIENAVLIPDETIDQGGCLLETSAGIIDARLKTQLEKIEYSLNSISSDPASSIDDEFFDTTSLEQYDAEA